MKNGDLSVFLSMKNGDFIVFYLWKIVMYWVFNEKPLTLSLEVFIKTDGFQLPCWLPED